MIYTIKNTGTLPLQWKLISNVNWISLTSTSGSVLPMQQTNIVVGINSVANSFGPGTYNGTLTFQNLTSNVGNTTRSVVLTVTPSGSATMAVSPTTGFSYTGPVGGPFGFDA